MNWLMTEFTDLERFYSLFSISFVSFILIILYIYFFVFYRRLVPFWIGLNWNYFNRSWSIHFLLLLNIRFRVGPYHGSGSGPRSVGLTALIEIEPSRDLADPCLALPAHRLPRRSVCGPSWKEIEPPRKTRRGRRPRERKERRTTSSLNSAWQIAFENSYEPSQLTPSSLSLFKVSIWELHACIFVCDRFFNVFFTLADDQPADANGVGVESNVSKDLTEWRERHATLVLFKVKVFFSTLLVHLLLFCAYQRNLVN